MRVAGISLLIWVQAYLFAPDLVKLPMLFMHYQEHQQELPDISWASFLALHYANAEHQDQDHQNHENLPFHHHHGTATDQCTAKVFENVPFNAVSFPALSARRAIAIPVDSDLLSGHNSELLRPPKGLA